MIQPSATRQVAVFSRVKANVYRGGTCRLLRSILRGLSSGHGQITRLRADCNSIRHPVLAMFAKDSLSLDVKTVEQPMGKRRQHDAGDADKSNPAENRITRRENLGCV